MKNQCSVDTRSDAYSWTALSYGIAFMSLVILGLESMVEIVPPQGMWNVSSIGFCFAAFMRFVAIFLKK